jgi:hypothetical protein
MDTIKIINPTNILLKHFFEIVQTKSVCLPFDIQKNIKSDNNDDKNHIICFGSPSISSNLFNNNNNNNIVQHQPYIIATITNEIELMRLAKIIKLNISYFTDLHLQIIYFDDDTLLILSQCSGHIHDINKYANILLEKFLNEIGQEKAQLLKGNLLTCQQFFNRHEKNKEYWQKLFSDQSINDGDNKNKNLRRQSLMAKLMIQSFALDNSLKIYPLCGHLSFKSHLFPDFNFQYDKFDIKQFTNTSIFFDYAVSKYNKDKDKEIEIDDNNDIFVSAIFIL